MELRPGFKQTEVGVIPEEWEHGQLGVLHPFVTSGSRGWARYYAERGDAFLRITNLHRESIYPDLSDLKYVELPKEGQEGIRTQLQEGDLLISITADIGIVGYVDESVPNPAYINQHIALVRFDRSKTDPRFLAYFLAGPSSQRAFRSATDQGAKAGMNLLGVRQMQSAFPALAEQQAIAAALGDVDDLIAALDRQIAKTRAVKQGTMQALLTGETRLPGFDGVWDTKTLSEIAEINMGQSPDSAFYNRQGHGLPLVQGNADIVDRKTVGRVWTTVAPKQCKSGSLLLTVRAPVGEVAIASEDICLGRGVCALLLTNCDKYFLYQKLMSLERKWSALEQASTFASANSKQILEFPLYMPADAREQRAIAAVLSDMDAEIDALVARRDKTAQIKQGMMQELLTGRTRLV